MVKEKPFVVKGREVWVKIQKKKNVCTEHINNQYYAIQKPV